MSSEENKKTSEKHIKQALENIAVDRAKADLMFTDLADYILKGGGEDSNRHEKLGPVIAKYMDTLVKSNEQLIKIAAAMVKDEIAEDEDDSLVNVDDYIEETQLSEGEEKEKNGEEEDDA